MFEHDLLLKMCLYHNCRCMPITVEAVFQKVKDDNKIPNNCLVLGPKASISFCCIILFFFFTFEFRRPDDLHLCLICGDCRYIRCTSTFDFLIPAHGYLTVKEEYNLKVRESRNMCSHHCSHVLGICSQKKVVCQSHNLNYQGQSLTAS